MKRARAVLRHWLVRGRGRRLPRGDARAAGAADYRGSRHVVAIAHRRSAASTTAAACSARSHPIPATHSPSASASAIASARATSYRAERDRLARHGRPMRSSIALSDGRRLFGRGDMHGGDTLLRQPRGESRGLNRVAECARLSWPQRRIPASRRTFSGRARRPPDAGRRVSGAHRHGHAGVADEPHRDAVRRRDRGVSARAPRLRGGIGAQRDRQSRRRAVDRLRRARARALRARSRRRHRSLVLRRSPAGADVRQRRLALGRADARAADAAGRGRQRRGRPREDSGQPSRGLARARRDARRDDLAPAAARGSARAFDRAGSWRSPARPARSRR